ncbi:MAG: hypothetical protein SOY88_09205 [Massilioclostridium sp.]|nr:hypothetical protein [Massilioclostridium sp.]
MKKICSSLLAFCLCVTLASGCAPDLRDPPSSQPPQSSSEASSQAVVTKTSDFDESTNQLEELFGVSYQVPASWERSQDGEQSLFYTPKSGGKLLVGIYSEEKDFDLSSKLNAYACADAIQEGFEGTDGVEDLKMTSIGQNSAIRFSFSTTGLGFLARMDCLLVNVPAGVFGWVMVTPDDCEYDYTNDFNQILKSAEIAEEKPHTVGEPVDIIEDGVKIGTLTINSVTRTDKRNRFAEETPAEVVIIDYTYENTASEDDLYLFSSYFQVIDSGGNVCTTHPLTGLTHAQKAPVGAKSTAQEAYNLTVESPTITFIFKPKMFDNKDAIKFELPVQ